MGSNEEYLDKLLQSVTTGDKTDTVEEHKYSEDMTDDELLASLIEMYSDELAEFKTEEIIHKEESDAKEATEEISVPEEVQAETEIEPESNLSLDDLLGANSFLENEFEGITAEENTEKVTPEETYTTPDSDFLSQSDIEALLSNLQDDLSQTPTEVVNEEKIIEDFSKEEDSVLEEILSEPQMIDEQDADILIRDLDAENSPKTEENLLKEMGIESMSAEQIDQLLNEAAAAENPEDTFTTDSNEMNLDALFGGLTFADDFDPEHKASEEMADLLGGMLGGGDELAEINNLLQQADSHENADDSNLRNMLNMDEDIGGNDLLNELLQAEAGIMETAETDAKKEKKQKVKKEKQPKEKKEGESLWNKLTSILFEEEEELDDNKVRIVDGDGLANLIDASENDAILAEMMSEDKQKGKKSKKKDKDKNVKNKKDNAKAEDGEEVAIDPKEQAKLEKQKQKAEKKAAKKKAKEEKAEADRAFLKAQPSISTKRAMVAFAFAITLMAVILIIYIFVPDAVEKGNARKAYYDKDYYEAFELLQGKDLNDSDTILLNKVTCILKMQRKLDSYNNYVKMDKELEALNALVEAVRLYGENYTYASALSIDDEYNAIYDEIKIILNGKYGVSEERAKEILAYESDAQYTISLQDIVNGKALNTPDTDDSKKPLDDVLPEEEDFLKGQ